MDLLFFIGICHVTNYNSLNSYRKSEEMIMMNKKSFIKWLENNTNISPYSVNRYANAIDTISSELSIYGLNEKNLFHVCDTTIIDNVLFNPYFQQKNNKGNRMYSAALNYFKTYIEYSKVKDQFQTELLKEEIEFEKYLKENPAGVSKRTIKDKVKERPSYRTVNNQKIWNRNPRYASDVLANAGYLCEFNNQHQHFISMFNQKNYVEAHHLIPMKYQDQFDCSLDTYANIVSLCLVCHKKIHFGLFEDKRKILDKLFKSRKERLKNCGINIGDNEFYSYYQVK